MKERFSLGVYQSPVNEALTRAGAEKWVERIWSRDGTLWKEDPAHRKIIGNSLGWLTVAEDLQGRIGEVQVFTEEVRRAGFETACLLGMGGSSLCPEVCSESFGTAPGYLRLVALDTTDPAGIAYAARNTNLSKTLFIVASKSGGTIETLSQQKYFHDELRKLKGDRAGDNFVAITDPGTSLEKLAADLRFFKVFLNPSDIGGRFSALSFFGLVPMSLIGMDIGRVIERAIAMAERCRVPGDPQANAGLRLGAAIGALAKQGRDKLTFVLSPDIRTFGWWVEQLIAESTGKEGVGIVPVEGEELPEPAACATDRVFVWIGRAERPEPEVHTALKALEDGGHPVIWRGLEDRYDLAGEFFLWEFATAVAGAVLRINPFDQPNVQESKDNTRRLISEFESKGQLDDGAPSVSEGTITLFGAPGAGGLRQGLDGFLASRRPGDYVALLAYVRRSAATNEALHRLRTKLQRRLGCAVTVGFGPRFLHSTGQLHKGGGNNGLFCQITVADGEDLPIPGEKYSFGTLKKAQAMGDLQALQQHGRRAIRLHAAEDPVAAIDRITALV